VDYLSGYIEVDRLPSKRVSDVIYCLKVQFARHGLPLEVVSDNNPFNAAEFRHFAAAYDFKHTTSSPHYPQSNGRAEAAVKTIKSLFEKAMAMNICKYIYDCYDLWCHGGVFIFIFYLFLFCSTSYSFFFLV
jgi:transposase InsO family protein